MALLVNPNVSRLRIRFQDTTEESTSSSSSKASVPPPKNPSTSLGFGSSISSKREKKRASIIRREPFVKPGFVEESGPKKELQQNESESAFVVAWFGLGAIILVEGILLAASGFLPEAWDNFFVKYLYPSFTPTVFLFVAGTVVYGVLKYLQNEKSNGEN